MEVATNTLTGESVKGKVLCRDERVFPKCLSCNIVEGWQWWSDYYVQMDESSVTLSNCGDETGEGAL